MTTHIERRQQTLSDGSKVYDVHIRQSYAAPDGDPTHSEALIFATASYAEASEFARKIKFAIEAHSLDESIVY